MARPTSRRSVTAAASIVDLSNPITVRQQQQARKPWQDTAWEFYRSMPEIRYPANFIGSALGRFQLRIGVLNPDDPTAPPHIPEGKTRPDFVRAAEDELLALQGPTGGMCEILKRYAINMNVAGDGWLIGLDQEDGIGGVDTAWEFVSIKELQFREHQGAMRAYRDPVGDGDVDTYNENFMLPPKTSYFRRFWVSHPERSQQADGPLEALRDDCERLRALNESITGRLLSRLAVAGLLYIPNSISLPILPSGTTGDTDLQKDKLIQGLLAYFEQAMTNRGTASGSLPILMRGPDDAGEKIKHIVLDRFVDQSEMELRKELRETITVGQDLPNDAANMSDATHWSAASIADSTVRNHLQPIGDRFSDGLLRVYLRPAVRLALPGAERSDLLRLAIVADGSAAVRRPNEAEDGRQLHDRVVLSDSALRTRSGASDGEQPDDDEYVRILGRQTHNPFLATWGLPVHDKVDWEEVAKVGSGPGTPGVGGTPPSRRPADVVPPAPEPRTPAKARAGRNGA